MTVLTMGPPRGGLVLSSLTPGMHYGPLSIVQGPLPPPATVQLLGVLSKCLCQLWNLCLQHCELKELLIHPASLLCVAAGRRLLLSAYEMGLTTPSSLSLKDLRPTQAHLAGSKGGFEAQPFQGTWVLE